MGIFSELFTKQRSQATASPPPARIEKKPSGPYDPEARRKYVGLSIVGESHYQEALRFVCGRTGNEAVDIDYVATLVPEPENPYDAHAVRVDIDGLTVGYLARGNARRYQRRVARMIEQGGDPTVPAFIGAQGPDGTNPNIGVVLHVPKDSPLEVPLSRTGTGRPSQAPAAAGKS